MISSVDGDKVIFLGDWYHTYSSVLLNEFMGSDYHWSKEPGTEPLADNLLLNGRPASWE
jgi:hypothetical protein